jgi:hypothetical protein
MSNYEKQFESFARRVNFDDAPDIKHRDKLEQLLLESFTSLQLQQSKVWRIIVKSRITKFAVAAGVVIAVIIGIYNFDGSIDAATVAWAETFKNVEACDTVIAHINIKYKGLRDSNSITEIDGAVYFSIQYGSWIDMANIIEKTPKYKSFSTVSVSVMRWNDANSTKINPKTIVSQFMHEEYVNLGRSSINGVEVEGIEIDNSKKLTEPFDIEIRRLWVNVDTRQPVKIEIESSRNDPERHRSIIIDDIIWGQDEPEIVLEKQEMALARHKRMMEPKLLEPNENNAIEGLRVFAELSNGKYPTSVDTLMIMKEATNLALQEDQKKHKYTTKELAIKIISIARFYSELLKTAKEPAYYGAGITAVDSNSVLIRWKISDNEYRVIYGDLTAENISTEQLAEMEAAISK